MLEEDLYSSNQLMRQHYILANDQFWHVGFDVLEKNR